MKKIILALASLITNLIVSPSFAHNESRIDSYRCGFQVGQTVSNLAKTTGAVSARYLSEDLETYLSQQAAVQAAKTEKDRKLNLEAAQNAWSSVLYSMGALKSQSMEEARAIDRACNLGIVD